MDIVKLTDISESQRFSDGGVLWDHLIVSIDIRDKSVGKLLDALSESYDEAELLKVLNSINNQGIQSIDVMTYSYVHRGNKLRFGDLCSAEKLFLVAYADQTCKEKVYFCSEIRSLTKTSLRNFIGLFGYSEYINIACLDELSVAYYKHVMNDALSLKDCGNSKGVI